MKKSLLTISVAVLMAMSSNVRAAAEEDAAQPDARLQGYQLGKEQIGSIELKDGRGAAGTWFTLIGLSLVGVGAMFKSGKRSHLD